MRGGRRVRCVCDVISPRPGLACMIVKVNVTACVSLECLDWFLVCSDCVVVFYFFFELCRCLDFSLFVLNCVVVCLDCVFV